MQFDLPKEHSSIIKVIGVGGGGSNAVNHMYHQGIKGVDFIVCNTDKQALDISPVPLKISLGTSLTEGRGAGSLPEVGKNAAMENIEEIREILAQNTKMVFITAGMGGGTGTGAAPVIAKIAKEMGLLTVAIVTIPFSFEGKKRRIQAEDGLEELKKNVDTLLVISNDKLREIYGNLKLTEAFGHADDVLSTAAKSIAEIITVTLHVNVDFADVKTVMKDSGVAIMGSATAEGENRAVKAVEMALSSPLLNDNNIRGARYVLLNITCGADEITMDELGEITDYIQDAAGQTAELIKGYGIDESLGGKVNVTIIATGFNGKGEDRGIESVKQPEKIILHLEEEIKPIEKVAEIVSKKEEETSSEIFSQEPFLIKKSPEEQTAIPFEITNKINPVPETKTELSETPIAQSEPVVSQETISHFSPSDEVKKQEEKKIDNDEQMRKARERVIQLKDLSFKVKTAKDIAELEHEPAYKRRNVTLDSTPHSSESPISRYTLTETEDKKVEIKPNNSFLHDNVD
ncbi:MAG: cell division protein FtsZ [Bacteroidia bacterium]